MSPPDATTASRAPRWQRLDADARRAQILECARREFIARPYDAVSMADIARCAGVRRGLLHHHFGTKHDLYVALVRDLLVRFDSVIDRVGEDGAATGVDAPTLESTVATHVDRWLDLVEELDDAWFALLDAEAATHDREVARLVSRARAAMVDGVALALGLDDATPGLRVVLRSYAGVAEVATREWLRRGSVDRAQVRALLVTTLVVMVREVQPAVAAATPARGRDHRVGRPGRGAGGVAGTST